MQKRRKQRTSRGRKKELILKRDPSGVSVKNETIGDSWQEFSSVRLVIQFFLLDSQLTLVFSCAFTEQK
jgi:hypothetical protein